MMRKPLVAIITGGFATITVDVLPADITHTAGPDGSISTETPRISYSVECGSGKERKKAQWKREINPTGKRGRRK